MKHLIFNYLISSVLTTPMSRIYDNNYSVQCLYDKFRVTIIDFGKGNIVFNKKLIVLLIT